MTYFISDAVEEHFSELPSQDEETKEELERQAPCHVSPDDVSSARREDATEENDDENTGGRNQSLSVVLCVNYEEGGDGRKNKSVEQPPALGRVDKCD